MATRARRTRAFSAIILSWSPQLFGLAALVGDRSECPLWLGHVRSDCCSCINPFPKVTRFFVVGKQPPRDGVRRAKHKLFRDLKAHASCSGHSKEIALPTIPTRLTKFQLRSGGT